MGARYLGASNTLDDQRQDTQKNDADMGDFNKKVGLSFWEYRIYNGSVVMLVGKQSLQISRWQFVIGYYSRYDTFRISPNLLLAASKLFVSCKISTCDTES
jgi:hypothetical protein